jgi:hypothetical protein
MEQIIDECVSLSISKQSSHQQGPIDEMRAHLLQGKAALLQQNMHQQPQKQQH